MRTKYHLKNSHCSFLIIVKYFSIMAKTEMISYLRHKAASVLLDNFSCYEASGVFGVDYKNLCAYVRGTKDMPIKLALDILEYCNCSLVVFNNH